MRCAVAESLRSIQLASARRATEGDRSDMVAEDEDLTVCITRTTSPRGRRFVAGVLFSLRWSRNSMKGDKLYFTSGLPQKGCCTVY